jgi:hypothetical protein
VRIPLVDHFISTNAPVDVPLTGSTVPRAVQVQGTTQQVFTGAWVDAGLAIIPNVPVGRLLINYSGTGWVDTTSSTVDIGADVSGRGNVAFGAAGTSVHFHVTNLSPWQPGFDFLEYEVPNNGSDYLIGEPDAGATTRDAGFNFQGVELIDSAQGDVLTLVQFRYQVLNAPGTDAGFIFSGRAERSAVLPAVTYATGSANTVAAMLAPVTRNQTATLDWRRAELANLRTQVNPPPRRRAPP